MQISKTNAVILGLVTFALVLAASAKFLISEKAPDATQPVPLEYNDIIRVSAPLGGDTISSPVFISGEARGQWFFEATFPIVVVGEDGLIIGDGFAEAEGDWMTEAYVPFTAQVEFTAPPGTSGTVILRKSNASDLPEHDDAVEIPVRFTDDAVRAEGA